MAWKNLQNWNKTTILIHEILIGGPIVSIYDSELRNQIFANLSSVGQNDDRSSESWQNCHLTVLGNNLSHHFQVHGYLQDASKLTIEYISAVLGNGKEFFGLSSGLHASSMPAWLPHNLIDQLLLELRDNSHDPDYHKVSLKKFKIRLGLSNGAVDGATIKVLT